MVSLLALLAACDVVELVELEGFLLAEPFDGAVAAVADGRGVGGRGGVGRGVGEAADSSFLILYGMVISRNNGRIPFKHLLAGIEVTKYLVEINGQNFLIEGDGNIAKHGFVTLRFVEAVDPPSAEDAAVQMLRDTQSLRDLVKNDAEDPPVMDVTQIAELETFDGIETLEPGFVWYEENPKRWWQFWRH